MNGFKSTRAVARVLARQDRLVMEHGLSTSSVKVATPNMRECILTNLEDIYH